MDPTLPIMDNLKCVLLLQRHVTKSYTAPKDEETEEWNTGSLCFSLHLLASTNLGGYSEETHFTSR